MQTSTHSTSTQLLHLYRPQTTFVRVLLCVVCPRRRSRWRRPPSAATRYICMFVYYAYSALVGESPFPLNTCNRRPLCSVYTFRWIWMRLVQRIKHSFLVDVFYIRYAHNHTIPRARPPFIGRVSFARLRFSSIFFRLEFRFEAEGGRGRSTLFAFASFVLSNFSMHGRPSAGNGVACMRP